MLGFGMGKIAKMEIFQESTVTILNLNFKATVVITFLNGPHVYFFIGELSLCCLASFQYCRYYNDSMCAIISVYTCEMFLYDVAYLFASLYKLLSQISYNLNLNQ